MSVNYKKFFDRVFRTEMRSRKWFSVVTITVAVAVLGSALTVFIFDPYYRYRWPSLYKALYYKSYATAPRLLNDFEYDTLLIGSSMAGNFFLNDINQIFSCKSLKLSVDGASSYDLKKLFDTAVEAKGKKLKRVIYLLDIYAVNKSEKRYLEFDYMYRNDHSEDYRYLFNRESLESVFYIWKRPFRLKGKRKYQIDPNRMFFSEHDKTRYSMEQVIASAAASVNNGIKPASRSTNFSSVLKNEVLAVFDRHPDIEFIVMMPPYHLYTWCLCGHFAEADVLLKQKTEILSALLKFKNVRVTDFQCDPEIICNGAYYTDIQHYSSALCRKMLEWAASGKYQLRSEADILANENKLRKMVKDAMPQFYNDIGKKM